MSELISCFALFDFGSPVSFIQRSFVPFKLEERLTMTSYRGLENKFLSTYGYMKYTFVFLPDAEAVGPLVVGRDLLNKTRIGLCRMKPKIKYNVKELIQIDKDNEARAPPNDERFVSSLVSI